MFDKGRLDLDPGESETLKVKPNERYEYNVLDYYNGQVLARSEVSVDACVSKGINIK